MNPISEFQSKIFFGIISLVSAGLSGLGAMLTEGDIRWFCITFSSSILTCGFLALIFKKPNESMQSVTGRSGISILGGIFGSKFIVYYFDFLHTANTDGIMLAFISNIVCILSFTIGYKVLKEVDTRSDKIAKTVTDKLEDNMP